MRDGDFDRLRIPMGNGPDGSTVALPDGDADEAGDTIDDVHRLGVAATPAQLAAGSAVLAGLILVGLAAFRLRRGAGSTGDGAT